MNPTGIYTALCYWCENGLERPLTAQEELLKVLYTDPEGTIEKVSKTKKKFNILDLMINTFQAIGFGKKDTKEEVDKEEIHYPTADNETSKQVAKRKKREPIFKFNKE